MAGNNDFLSKVAGIITEVAGNIGSTTRVDGFTTTEVPGNKSFMTSLLDLLNEDKFMKDVASKPCYGTEQVNVSDFLSLVQKILDPKGDQGQIKSLSAVTPRPFSSTINDLCCQITCEALHTNNACQTMESLFAKLSSFPWDTKAVLTLSAFSTYYAEHRHLARIEGSDYDINLAAALRGLHAEIIFQNGFHARPKSMIRVTLEFTKYTVELANLSKEFGALPTSINTKASLYQIIIGVIGCSVSFSGMISRSNEFLGQDLSTFSGRFRTKYESFRKQVENLREEHEEQRRYKEIVEVYRSRTDFAKLMAPLFCAEKNSLTVNQGFSKTTVEVQKLQNKIVMLLISDLTLSVDDICTLKNIYNEDEFKSSNYEIVWVLIADVKDDGQFQNKRFQMPCYYCNSIVSNAAAKFIKNYWQFKQQTKLIVLNKEGEVVNEDAMTMIRLWQLQAIPFTPKRGCKLWDKHENHWLKLLVETTVSQSIEKSWETKQLTFLYGPAEDSELVKQIDDILNITFASYKFTSLNVKNKRKQFLSCLHDCISWKRQVSTELYDSQTLQLLNLYNSYKTQSGFAIIARGSSVIVNTSFLHFWKVLSEHKEWVKKETSRDNFDTHFKGYYDKVFGGPRCSQFSIPIMDGNIPECIKCPTADCGRDMELETIVTFKCCHGEH